MPASARRCTAARCSRWRSGQWRPYSPARTPSTLKPLISARLTSSVGMRPLAKPITSSRPLKAMQRVDSSNTLPPTGSATTSAPRPPVASSTLSRKPADGSTTTPSAASAASRAGSVAVAMTRAPRCRPTCTQAWPTPPRAPCTSSVSPRASWPSRASATQAVRPVTVSAAAWSIGMPWGHGPQRRAGRHHLPGQLAVLAAQQNPLAGQPAAAGAGFQHHAGTFHARHVGRRGLDLVEPAGHQQIGKVQAHRGHRHAHVAGAERRQLPAAHGQAGEIAAEVFAHQGQGVGGRGRHRRGVRWLRSGAVRRAAPARLHRSGDGVK